MNKCDLCSKEIRRRSRCGSCITRIRRYRAKLAAVKYKGGKCIKCNWNGNIAAYEFHHRDPNAKDFSIGNVSNKSWTSIKLELDKCDILCANCHRIEHTGNRNEIFQKIAKDYNGILPL